MAMRIARDPAPRGGGVRMVATTNIDHVVQLHKDAAFRASYDRAWAVTADGWPVLLYARMVSGYRQGRVTGADLFPRIVRQLSPSQHRLFCLVSGELTAQKLRERLVREGLQETDCRIVVPPFGFESDSAYSSWLADEIAAFRTTHLVMGVGAPKSEIWVDQHRHRLADLYACCFGAGLNFYAGTRRRAPEWVQKIGMEWAWRIAGEPRRLAMRYLSGAPQYVAFAARDLLRPAWRD